MTYQNSLVVAAYNGQRDSLNPNGEAPGGPTPVNTITLQAFIHSLLEYDGGGPAPTTVYTSAGEWCGLFAQANGLAFGGSYTFGQFSNHNAQPWPEPSIGGRFDQAGGNTFNPNPNDGFQGNSYDTFFLTPSNYLEADMSGGFPYDFPTTTAQGEVEQLYDNIKSVYPNARVYLYIHTPLATPFGGMAMNRATFTTYNNAQMNEFLDWNIALQDAVVAGGRDLYSIPAYQCFTWCLENLPALQGLEFSEIYGDQAPHGSENAYCMIGLTMARALYAQEINLQNFTFPPAAEQMLQVIIDNIEDIQTNIYNRLVFHNANGCRVWPE